MSKQEHTLTDHNVVTMARSVDSIITRLAMIVPIVKKMRESNPAGVDIVLLMDLRTISQSVGFLHRLLHEKGPSDTGEATEIKSTDFDRMMLDVKQGTYQEPDEPEQDKST